jgi:acyl carrier protein
MEVNMFNELKEIICEYVEINPGEITENSRFIEDLGFTSYDFMSMVGELEDKYDIEVEERDVIQVKTVGDAVKYIQSLQA